MGNGLPQDTMKPAIIRSCFLLPLDRVTAWTIARLGLNSCRNSDQY